MGISNLLPMLERSTRPCHVSEFREGTVAVDSYCWLHKGARSCALQLARGEHTNQYVTYCLKYVKMLLSYDIRPIMVFDGRHLPAKLGTEEKRRELKKQARKQGMEYLRLGQKEEAYKYFCQCVEITPEMALNLIKECRKIQVDCIVAPYESDAQLAFFDLNGKADCIISEDSDLLLFGCKKVLYKMDVSGCGQLVEADKLYLSMKVRRDLYSFEKFRHMCILAGCDYLDSLPGIGIKKALKFITMTAETNPSLFLDRIPRYLNMKNLSVPEDYKENFLIADATFKHQIVFDPFQKKLIPLTAIDVDAKYCRNSGEIFDHKQAFQLAVGNLDPLTMQKIDNWDPDEDILSEYSIWSSIPKDRPKPSIPKSKSFKCKTLSPKAIDDVKTEHDHVIEKELEFYKSPVNGDVTVIENNSNISIKTDIKTSPVLSNNPFIRKKLSKFQMTQNNRDQKVISRYFSPTVAGLQESTVAFKSSSSSSSMMTVASEDDELEGEIARISPIEEVLITVSPDKSQGTASESDTGSMKTHGDCSHIDDDLTDVPEVECECIIEEEPGEIQIVPGPSTLSSVENLPSKTASRKRKSQSDEIPKKKTKRQLTIQDMFQKMNF